MITQPRTGDRIEHLTIVGMMKRFFDMPVDRTIRLLIELVVAMWRELTPEAKDRVLKALDPLTKDFDN
jgi:hypothetical protein